MSEDVSKFLPLGNCAQQLTGPHSMPTAQTENHSYPRHETIYRTSCE